MSSRLSILQSLKEFSDRKLQQYTNDIDDVHGVWLQEIKREADRVLTGDLSAPPELMPKTPSQKRSRKKRVSRVSQEGPSSSRRFSKGKRSKIRGSTVKPLDVIGEDEGIPQASTSGQVDEQPKRSTRRNKQTQPEASLEAEAFSDCSAEQVPEEEPEVVAMASETAVPDTETELEADEPQPCSPITIPSLPNIPAPKVSVRISLSDRRSAELAAGCFASPGRIATRGAMAGTPGRARRSSVSRSLKKRYSKAGLRHSMMQDAVRRASRRSKLRKKSTRGGNTTCSSNASDDSCMEVYGDVEKNRELPSVESDEGETAVEEVEATAETPEPEPVDPHKRVTRSRADDSPSVLLSPALTSEVRDVPGSTSSGITEKADVGSRSSLRVKRKSPDIQEDSPTNKLSPPRKSKLVTRPNMRAFLQSAQKKQRLMTTPTSGPRSAVVKSFIKHTTPLRIDAKSKELLEALKRKHEQEEENMKKMEEEKRRKQEEQKRKREERLRRVVEARTKEEEEKKKRIKLKMSQNDGKNKKMHVEGMAGEKAKLKAAVKRQEEVEQKKRLEEEVRLKKLQQAEEAKWQQDLVVKRAAEEEERAHKLAEARRVLELRREQEKEWEKELEKERRALAEREKEKALALQRELERAAREKRELEEKKKLEERRWREEQQQFAAENAAREMEAAKLKMAAALVVLNNVQSSVFKTPVRTAAALNITMEVEKSPQSYSITPKGGNKPPLKSTNAEDYGMDQNSGDSTDDEGAPRKPIPSWANGVNLQQAITQQYFSPPDLYTYFGVCEPPRLEVIFYKSKPRYFKRTSSAVWHSPPPHGQY